MLFLLFFFFFYIVSDSTLCATSNARTKLCHSGSRGWLLGDATSGKKKTLYLAIQAGDDCLDSQKISLTIITLTPCYFPNSILRWPMETTAEYYDCSSVEE